MMYKERNFSLNLIIFKAKKDQTNKKNKSKTCRKIIYVILSGVKY